MAFRKAYIIIIYFCLSACSSKETLILIGEYDGFQHYEINTDVEPDEDMVYFMEPYVLPIQRMMNRVLTVSEGDFTINRPEGTMGNLTADILRSRATYEMRARVDIAIFGNELMGISLNEGEVTVGQIYDLLPGDNSITVMKFTGEQVLQIADEIAAAGGEPISGMRMRIQDGKARDVLVGNRQVNPERYYLIATNDLIANGGGNIPTLWTPLERIDHELLVREAMIDYLNSRQTITPFTDFRLR